MWRWTGPVSCRRRREQTAGVLVNPRIVWRSEKLETCLEGCLSFNIVVVPVRRLFAVRVKGFDAYGKPDRTECEGFPARSGSTSSTGS